MTKAEIIYNIEKDVFSSKESFSNNFSKPYSFDAIYQALKDKNKVFYLLKDRQLNEVVGYAALIITPDYNDIFSLAVKRRFQKLGYGKKLMQWVAKKSVGKKVFLEVYDQNEPAIKLYKSSGYKIIDKRQNYFGQGKNALIMVKEVDKT
ncbi:MAG: GNAT family N-acetyltransferase [Bifidobacteriaceae bacterium]|jgi:ribosomal-protein-alanine N-acetyltransferase|nr:GNAT family N-acetyltransferase [Bifidobacteriaceae bacterium]